MDDLISQKISILEQIIENQTVMISNLERILEIERQDYKKLAETVNEVS